MAGGAPPADDGAAECSGGAVGGERDEDVRGQRCGAF